MDGCDYFMFAQYACTTRDIPSEGVVGDHRLVAYHDSNRCGINGNDFQWDWCDRSKNCPHQKAVDVSICPSGHAHLEWFDPNGLRLNGCDYFMFAQYACTGGDPVSIQPVPLPDVSIQPVPL